MDSQARSSSGVDPLPALSSHDYCGRVQGEVDTLASLVAGSDLAVRIPWSRTWKLGDLIHHVGAIHRWAARIVELDVRRYLPIRDADDWPGEGGSTSTSGSGRVA